MANNWSGMKDHIQGLKATRRLIREEEVRLRRDGAKLDNVIRQLEAMTRAGSSPTQHANGRARLRSVPALDLNSLTQREAAKVVLSESSRHLTIREILNEFKRAGRAVSPKNAYRSLYHQLREDKRFTNTRGQWRLADATDANEEPNGAETAAVV